MMIISSPSKTCQNPDNKTVIQFFVYLSADVTARTQITDQARVKKERKGEQTCTNREAIKSGQFVPFG